MVNATCGMRLADYLIQLTPERNNSIAWINRHHDGSISRAWTWIEIQRLTAAAATFLLDHSVRPGDRIANLGRNSLAWAVLDLACSAINAVHAPIDTRFSSSQKQHCIALVKPTMVFSDVAMTSESTTLEALTSLAHVDQPLARIALPFGTNDLANILFTSGTTGVQKGVMLSHKNLQSNALAKLDAMPQVDTDHRLNFLPFSHAYARTCELTTWLVSNSCMEVANGIEDMFQRGAFAKPSLINGVPVFYESIEKKRNPRQDLRVCVRELFGGQVRRLASGGATLPALVRGRFEAIGLPIFQGYGLTECSPVICSNRSGESDQGVNGRCANLVEVGPPVKGINARIDAGGRLWVSGDGVMLGYWQDADGTNARIVNGWLDTGDLAEYVEDVNRVIPSAIRILGRSDDTLVLSNGYKVQPMPIEQTILAEPWVEQCILVGTKRAFPVLILKPNELGPPRMLPDKMMSRIEHVLGDFPRHAIPRRLILVNEAWTRENGLVNFKGAQDRKKIESYYEGAINQLYQSSM